MPSDVADDRWLVNATEAARRLSMSKSKLWELTTSGVVPHVRIGGRMIRYRPATLAAWVAAQEQEGQSNG